MKVRGTKLAEFEQFGATFAVVKLADAEESEYVTPGSDQADAVLRLEAIADRLQCSPEYIEERIDYLTGLETDRRDYVREYLNPNIQGNAQAPTIEDVFAHPDPEHEVECSEPNAKVQAFNSVFHEAAEQAAVRAPISWEDMPPNIRELIEVAEDMGLQPVAVIGTPEEIEEFIAQLEEGE